MSELMKSSPELEAALSQVHDVNDLRETLLATLAAQNQIVRTRDQFDNRAIRQTQAEGSPLAASQYRYEKEIYFAESTGKRPLVIRATNQADLDALERQVTGQ
jgi:hypothetical protein